MAKIINDERILKWIRKHFCKLHVSWLSEKVDLEKVNF